MKLYAQIILSFVNYCRDTSQIVHVILDSNKSPIAIVNPTNNSIRKIFKGLKGGK